MAGVVAHSRSRSLPAPVAAVLGLALLLVAGCAPPDRGAAGAGGAVRRQRPGRHGHPDLDAHSGRGAGAPRSPWGPPRRPARRPHRTAASSLLSGGAARGHALTHLTPHRRPTGGPCRPRRRVAAPGAAGARCCRRTRRSWPATATGHAVVVLAGIGPDAPRLALVDARTGAVERTHPVPVAADEVVRCVALERAPAGPIAYLGLWRWPAGGRGAPAAAGPHPGRARGPPAPCWAAAPLAGAPAHLLVARVAGRYGQEDAHQPRLGCTPCCSAPARAVRMTGRRSSRWRRGSCWPLTRPTLVAQRTHPLDDRLTALAGSAGRAAPLRARPSTWRSPRRGPSPGSSSSTSPAVPVRPRRTCRASPWASRSPASGSTSPTRSAPKSGPVDRRSGRPDTIPVGQHPTDVSLAGALATT